MERNCNLFSRQRKNLLSGGGKMVLHKNYRNFPKVRCFYGTDLVILGKYKLKRSGETVMESLFKLSKTAFSWIPGNPVRKALYMNIFLWLLIGGGIGALAGKFFSDDRRCQKLGYMQFGGRICPGAGG